MPYRFAAGQQPILLSIPHNGSSIPTDVAATMTEAGRGSRDTDWFLDRLLNLPGWRDASVLVAEYSRYVIDLNRPLADVPLYPGQFQTGLLPERTFSGDSIYKDAPPSADERRRRIERYWQPYHAKIAAELARLRETHGVAVLLEMHSIASQCPLLFDGRLRDFNLGSNRGASCHTGLMNAVKTAVNQYPNYSVVADDRFVGGYITRHYGNPDAGIHAFQVELSQATYMNEPDLSWNPDKAIEVQKVLDAVGQEIQSWVLTQLSPERIA